MNGNNNNDNNMNVDESEYISSNILSIISANTQLYNHSLIVIYSLIINILLFLFTSIYPLPPSYPPLDNYLPMPNRLPPPPIELSLLPYYDKFNKMIKACNRIEYYGKLLNIPYITDHDLITINDEVATVNIENNIDATKLYTDISYNEDGVRLAKTFNFKIQVEGSDVLICGYDALCPFTIVTQPVWNDPEWQPYDITGHGNGLAYEGNGSLQIIAGQTVEFTGSIRPGQLVPL
jgi:hypothetical protein